MNKAKWSPTATAPKNTMRGLKNGNNWSIWFFKSTNFSIPTPVLSPTVVSSVKSNPDTQTGKNNDKIQSQLIINFLTQKKPLIPLWYVHTPTLNIINWNTGFKDQNLS